MASCPNLGMWSGATAGLLAGAVFSAALAATPPARIGAPEAGADRIVLAPPGRLHAGRRAARSSSVRPPRVKPAVVNPSRAGPPVPGPKPSAVRAAVVPVPEPRPARRVVRVAPPPESIGSAAGRRDTAREPDGRPRGAAPARIAALPPAPERSSADSEVSGLGSRYRLGFASGVAELDGRAGRTLDRVVDGLKSDGRLRLQLVAYAGGNQDTPRQARRLSLARALSVRSYLIGKGVRSARIDVRAVGNRHRDGPPDRVDIVVTRR